MQSKLGARIRKYRTDQGMTREELAERTGQSRTFITALEEEDLYPSLGPLIKIARALGLRLGTFIDDETMQDPCIVRAGDRTRELTMHGARNTPASLTFYSLGKFKLDRHMEPFYITIQPDRQDPELSSHEGEEFIVVQSGSVSITYGQEKYVLEPGDSMYLNSVVPHHVGCEGDQPADIYAVIYFPG